MVCRFAAARRCVALGRPSGVLAGPGSVFSRRASQLGDSWRAPGRDDGKIWGQSHTLGSLRRLVGFIWLSACDIGFAEPSSLPIYAPVPFFPRRYNGRTFRAIVEARRPRRVDVSGAGPLG